jgi:hypothetical protein
MPTSGHKNSDVFSYSGRNKRYQILAVYVLLVDDFTKVSIKIVIPFVFISRHCDLRLPW